MKRIALTACLLLFFCALPSMAGFESVAEALLSLEGQKTNAKKAYGYLLKCDPQSRRPMILLRIAKKNMPKGNVVTRGCTFDYCVSLMGSWRVLEAVPFLLEHIDIRYDDFTYGKRRERETRVTEDFFPCLQAIRGIGKEAIPSLVDFVILEGNTEKGKLALSYLIRMSGKNEALKSVEESCSEKELFALKGLLAFGRGWHGGWVLESHE